MAEITKDGLPSLCSQLPPHGHRIPFDGLTPEVNCLGEDVVAGDTCCVRSDGLVYKTDATGDAPAANASYHGFAPQSLNEGEPISLIWGERFSYAENFTPGTWLYPSGTVAGGLADAPAFDGQQPCAFAINETDIQCLPPYSGLSVYNSGASAVAIAAITPLTDNSGGTANNTLEDINNAVTGVDGVGSNAASKADVDARLIGIANNVADLAAKVNEIIAALQG